MYNAHVHLKSMAPYSQGKAVATERTRDETALEHDRRTWRERCHVDAKGQVFIPPQCFKHCLAEAAKYKSIQIPGKGKATYTKHCVGGVQVFEPLPLGIQIGDVQYEDVFVPADGVSGSGKRVWKRFPVFQEWEGIVTYVVMDEVVTPEVLEEHIRDSGRFIGIGRYRARNNGMYGRFTLVSMEIEKIT